jgi:hypothetical protein
MKILAARKVLDTNLYIPVKAMASPTLIQELQQTIDSGAAKIWTEQTEGRRILLAEPCNAQMWAPGFGRYDIQLEEEKI